MDSDEKEAAPRNSAAFKLSVLETCAADPLMKPIDVALLTAYLKFMKWPKRTAYMPNLKARVLTGTKSEETISISRARLVKRGYLRQVMDKLNGSTIYEMNNPRAEIVADHVRIAEEKLKEMDAYRKAMSRNRPRKIRDAKHNQVTENPRDTSRKIRDNSFNHSLERRAPKEATPQSNSYAAMSRGSYTNGPGR